MERLKKQWVNFQWSDHSYYNIGFKSTVNKCLQAEKQNFCKLDHCYHSFSAEKQAIIEDAVVQKIHEGWQQKNENTETETSEEIIKSDNSASTSENIDQNNESQGDSDVINVKKNIKFSDRINENIESTKKCFNRRSSYEEDSITKRHQVHLAGNESSSIQKETLSDLSNSPELQSPRCVHDDNFFCDKRDGAKDNRIISGENSEDIVIPLTCKFSKKRVDHNYCDRGNKKARKESIEFRKNDHTYIRRPRTLSCDFPSSSADSWQKLNVEIEVEEVPHVVLNYDSPTIRGQDEQNTSIEIDSEEFSHSLARCDIESKDVDDEQNSNVEIDVEIPNAIPDCDLTSNNGLVNSADVENSTNIEIEVEIPSCHFLRNDGDGGSSIHNRVNLDNVPEALSVTHDVAYPNNQLQRREHSKLSALCTHGGNKATRSQSDNNTTTLQNHLENNVTASSDHLYTTGNGVQNQNIRPHTVGSHPNLLLQPLIEGQSAFNLAFGSSVNVATAIPINPQSMPNLNLQDLPTTGITLTPFRIPVPIISPIHSLLFQPSLLSMPNFQSSPSLEQVEPSGTTTNSMPILNIPTVGDLFTTASNLRPMSLERRDNSIHNQSTPSNASMESINEIKRDIISHGDCVIISSTADDIKPSMDGGNQGSTSIYLQEDVESFKPEEIIVEENVRSKESCDSCDLNLITASLATSQINGPEPDNNTELIAKPVEKSNLKKKSSANIDKGAKSIIQKRTVNKISKVNNPFGKPVKTSRSLIQAVMTDHTYEVDKVSGQKLSIEKDHCYKKKSESEGRPDFVDNLMDCSEIVAMETHNIDHNYVPAL